MSFYVPGQKKAAPTAGPANGSAGGGGPAAAPPRVRVSDVLAGLKPIVHRPNWPARPLSHYLLLGRAKEMDGFTARLVRALETAYPGELQIGWAHEATVTPGKLRPLRVVRVIQPGHVACTDVHLYAQGDNLGVRFLSRGRSRIVWYRIALYAVLFLASFTLAYAFYLGQTDQLTMLARDYARKLAEGDNVDIKVGVLRNGDATHAPMGYLDYFRADPSLFLLDVGKVPAMLAAGIGVLLKLMPPDPLRMLCTALASPRPEEFTEHVQAHDVAVDAAMDGVLLRHPSRITEHDKQYITRPQ